MTLSYNGEYVIEMLFYRFLSEPFSSIMGLRLSHALAVMSLSRLVPLVVCSTTRIGGVFPAGLATTPLGTPSQHHGSWQLAKCEASYVSPTWWFLFVFHMMSQSTMAPYGTYGPRKATQNCQSLLCEVLHCMLADFGNSCYNDTWSTAWHHNWLSMPGFSHFFADKRYRVSVQDGQEKN